jgi:predicted TIM-barrel enzyme
MKIPVLIGSGVTNENLSHYKSANGLIVGSHFKMDGHWTNELDTKLHLSQLKQVSSYAVGYLKNRKYYTFFS